MSKRLESVTKAKNAYVLAKSTLEAKLREQMRDELANLQAQIDIAVRVAYDNGSSKADIMRALGTSDYHTINASLERTKNVSDMVGIDPFESVYKMVGSDMIMVTYDNYGPNKYSGQASFTVKKLDDGSYLFLAIDKLWSDDFTTRNDVVAVLDGVRDGFYYEDLCEWIVQR